MKTMTQDVRDLIADARGAMTERDDTGWFWVGRLVDALEAVLGERDAATEAKWLCGKCSRDQARGYDDGQIPEHHRTCRKRTEAERDAAVASIERVKAVLFKRYTGSPGYENTPEHVKEIDAIRDLYGETLADDLLAALDGAPEPEWEYAREYRDEAGDPHIRTTQDVTSPDGQRADGTPYWNYQPVRRRKAGPWLPVEGESK